MRQRKYTTRVVDVAESSQDAGRTSQKAASSKRSRYRARRLQQSNLTCPPGTVNKYDHLHWRLMSEHLQTRTLLPQHL